MGALLVGNGHKFQRGRRLGMSINITDEVFNRVVVEPGHWIRSIRRDWSTTTVRYRVRNSRGYPEGNILKAVVTSDDLLQSLEALLEMYHWPKAILTDSSAWTDGVAEIVLIETVQRLSPTESARP